MERDVMSINGLTIIALVQRYKHYAIPILCPNVLYTNNNKNKNKDNNKLTNKKKTTWKMR